MKSSPAIGRLRGKTRAGRLALWDALLVKLWPDAVQQGVLEVGAGERADTVLELCAAVDGPVAVMELHPLRAAMVRAAVDPTRVAVVEGDALAVDHTGGTHGLVRCANVLRQYPVARVPVAHAALGTRVRTGGVVLEGSCDAGGDVGAFHVLQRTDTGLHRVSLVFWSSFARGFAPIQLRDWLPRDLRKQVRAGGVMLPFFDRWTAAWKAVREGRPAADFRRAADALDLPWIDLSAVREGAAAMVWSPPGGVPRPTE